MSEEQPQPLPDGAQSWVTDALGGVEVSVSSSRIRPWSGVWELMSASGGSDRWWFKENRHSGRHEPALSAALARISPLVDEPVAIDPARSRLLMRDAGQRLRERLDAAGTGQAPLTLATWAELLPRYAELQLAAIPLVGDLAAAGVPMVAPMDHPGLFDDLLGEDEWLRPGISPEMSFETYAQLCGAQALVAEAVDAVEAAGIGVSVQHDDLHDGNVFVRPGDPHGFSIIDWGDTYLGHPFGTLLVTLNGIANRLGLDTATEPPELARLVDAYLEPFTGAGRTLKDLLAVLPPVLLLARIGRAESWRRMFAGDQSAAAAMGWADSMPGWFASVVDGRWV
jgi:Phosphotransferase enzyme family